MNKYMTETTLTGQNETVALAVQNIGSAIRSECDRIADRKKEGRKVNTYLPPINAADKWKEDLQMTVLEARRCHLRPDASECVAHLDLTIEKALAARECHSETTFVVAFAVLIGFIEVYAYGNAIGLNLDEMAFALYTALAGDNEYAPVKEWCRDAFIPYMTK